MTLIVYHELRFYFNTSLETSHIFFIYRFCITYFHYIFFDDCSLHAASVKTASDHSRRFYSPVLQTHWHREGINLTTSQAKKLGDLIKPYIDNGQSIYAALTDHPEITQCEKTIYNYINQGVFSVNGLINLDLRLKPSRKPTKKVVSKVRKDRAYLKGRTYKCFTEYMDLHPYSSVVEMDRVVKIFEVFLMS